MLGAHGPFGWYVVKCEKILSIVFNYIYFYFLGQPLRER
jgi:hypothetical protein